jgi:phosphoribosyl-ATP pyrophosphohydrolase
VSGDTPEQLEEAADLLFHMLVLLSSKRLVLADVVKVLERRHRRRE